MSCPFETRVLKKIDASVIYSRMRTNASSAISLDGKPQKNWEERSVNLLTNDEIIFFFQCGIIGEKVCFAHDGPCLLDGKQI